MIISNTDITNYYIVSNGPVPVAGFKVIENQYTGETSVQWSFGEDDVPLEIISQANQIRYIDED